MIASNSLDKRESLLATALLTEMVQTVEGP